jgi:hypothetical protein
VIEAVFEHLAPSPRTRARWTTSGRTRRTSSRPSP